MDKVYYSSVFFCLCVHEVTFLGLQVLIIYDVPQMGVTTSICTTSIST